MEQAIFIPAMIKTIPSPYDYSAIWTHLEAKGKQIFGRSFSLYHDDAEVVLKLIIWAIKDEELAVLHNINLDKGILLAGPVGCGKTSLIKLARYFLPYFKRHPLISCRNVAHDYAANGYPVITRYTKNSFHTWGSLPQYPDGPLPLPICFDDLGLETEVQYFGNA